MSGWVIEGGKEREGGADGEVGARFAGDSVIIMPGVDSRCGWWKRGCFAFNNIFRHAAPDLERKTELGTHTADGACKDD